MIINPGRLWLPFFKTESEMENLKFYLQELGAQEMAETILAHSGYEYDTTEEHLIEITPLDAESQYRLEQAFFKYGVKGRFLPVQVCTEEFNHYPEVGQQYILLQQYVATVLRTNLNKNGKPASRHSGKYLIVQYENGRRFLMHKSATRFFNKVGASCNIANFNFGKK